jgi:molybdopterin-guanine dinucleotide biosynthesis protein A
VLGEACEERIAVGKAADALPLPFPVLDDGVPGGRAPVFGVIAGLRAARGDACLVLPVDCPLVTPGALRALVDAVAVPRTGPLPGAYTKAMLASLEQRVAQGELSLRGVNPRELDLDPRLLVDVDTPAALEAIARPGHALVIGGTGMLTGVTHALAGRGHAVTVVARRAIELEPKMSFVAVDYRDTAVLKRGLEQAVAACGSIDLAVAWIHTDAPDAPGAVAGAVAPGGRVVQVFGNRVWPLDPVPLHVAYRQVLLGSLDGRWLTHDEISAGVLAAIDADRPIFAVGER